MPCRALGFFPPRAFKAFQGLDALRGVVIHPLEDHQAVAGRLNHVPVDLEAISLTQAMGLELCFDQRFRGLREVFLDFANTDGPHALTRYAGLCQTVLDQQVSQGMRLTRSPATPHALVPGRLQQRLEDLSRLYSEGGQSLG